LLCPKYSKVHAILDARAPNVSSYTTTEVSSSIPSVEKSFAARSGLSSDNKLAKGRLTEFGI
jgi:hypothetical protein